MSGTDQNNRQPEQMLPWEVIGQVGGSFEQQQGQGIGTPAATPGSGPAPMMAGATATAPSEPTTRVSTHQLEHVGVRCDHCNKTVSGFRYKCCQCRDYDLCAACEQLGIHAGHVMLRIPFPEMARDAIRSHILKASRVRGRSPSPPVVHLGFGGVSAAPGAGAEEADRHCGRGRHGGKRHRGSGHHGHGHHPYQRHHDESSTSAESSDEAPFPLNYGAFGAAAGGCPVMAGKKEMKKWCKYMKKNAHVHKKAAKEYAKRMGGTSAAAGASAEEGANPQAPQGFDLAATAHQIQEFLNAAGIPIDVVELYNEWGSSQGTARAGASTTATANAEATTGTGTNKNQASSVGAAEGPAPTAAPATDAGAPNVNANLAEELRDLHIGSGASAQAPAATAAPTSTAAAVAMDVQGVPAPAATPGQAPRIYPQLNPAHFQQMMTGISNVVGNVARNIPIAPWNAPGAQSGPTSATAPETAGATATATPLPTPAGGNGNQPELGDRMQQTLNQLLSMGFSNHDGWLGRLVASKKGNLEEVLNALFPVGGGAPAGAGGNGPHTLD